MKSKYDFYVMAIEGHIEGSKEHFPVMTMMYPLSYAEARAACKLFKKDEYEGFRDMLAFLADPEGKIEEEIVITAKPKGIKLANDNLVDISTMCLKR